MSERAAVRWYWRPLERLLSKHAMQGDDVRVALVVVQSDGPGIRLGDLRRSLRYVRTCERCRAVGAVVADE